MANTGTIQSEKILFGSATVFLGAAGFTPVVDVGPLTDAGLAIEVTREQKHLRAGTPKSIVKSFTTQSDCVMTFAALEFDMSRLDLSLGGGTYATNVSMGDTVGETYVFGPSACGSEVSVMAENEDSCNGRIFRFKLWKAISVGGLSLALNEEAPVAYEFQGVPVSEDWDLNALPSGKDLFRIELEAA